MTRAVQCESPDERADIRTFDGHKTAMSEWSLYDTLFYAICRRFV